MDTKKKQTAPDETAPDETTEVFVLCDCPFGKCGEVVEMPSHYVKHAKDHGMIDTSEAAITAAKK